MSGMVGELLEQSKHFGVLLHDLYERVSTSCRQVHVETSKQNLEKNWTCSSIHIYGMGGVEKTTLAKHIHTHLVNEIRNQLSWVSFSRV